MKHTLNVGDKILKRYGSKADKIITIERVTPTQAIAGNYRFKREQNTEWIFKEIGDSVWSNTTYEILTAENEREYHEFRNETLLSQRKKALIADIERLALSKDKIDRIRAIIEE